MMSCEEVGCEGSNGAGDASEESDFCVNGGAVTISGVRAEDTDDLDETGAVTTGAGDT